MEDMNLALSVFSSGVASVYVIELLKKSPLMPLITEQTVRANRLLGVLASGLATLGIGFTFDAEAGTMMITGLTFAAIVHNAWHWFTQWAVQQYIYASAIEAPKKGRVGGVGDRRRSG